MPCTGSRGSGGAVKADCPAKHKGGHFDLHSAEIWQSAETVFMNPGRRGLQNTHRSEVWKEVRARCARIDRPAAIPAACLERWDSPSRRGNRSRGQSRGRDPRFPDPTLPPSMPSDRLTGLRSARQENGVDGALHDNHGDNRKQLQYRFQAPLPMRACASAGAVQVCGRNPAARSTDATPAKIPETTGKNLRQKQGTGPAFFRVPSHLKSSPQRSRRNAGRRERAGSSG